MIAKVLASATLKLITNSLYQAAGSEHRAFRVKNLLADETTELVQLWDAQVSKGKLADISLVVASSLEGRVAERYVADPSRSITWYRNNIRSGLVYLETEDQSDAQGLQNFFTLRDSNFLDGSFDKYAEPYQEVSELITSCAWEQLQPGKPVPTLLVAKLRQIARTIHREIEPIPVRKFVHFATEVCERWADDQRAKDDHMATAIVGQALWILDLFPDEAWHDTNSESRTTRRLELNARYADLRSATGDLDLESLAETAGRVDFRDVAGNLLPPDQIRMWRQTCIDYIFKQDSATLCKIPYYVFEQLFHKDTKGMLLGERVWAEVDAADSSRIPELQALDLTDGLNLRSPADAERFLTHSSEPFGTPSLASLLTAKTRKMLERLANPPAKVFSNPMIETARRLEQMREQHDSETVSTLRLELAADPNEVSATLALFAFIYGRILRDVAEASQEAGGCKFTVDERLVSIKQPPPIEAFAGNGEGELQIEVTWPELPVRLEAYDINGELLECVENMHWRPVSIKHLALFWLMVADETSPLFRGLGGCKATEEMLLAGNDWMEPLVARVASLEAIPSGDPYLFHGEHPFADQVIALRQEFKKDATANGISPEGINTYFDSWSQLLESARLDFVPDGARVAVVDAFITTDTISFGSAFRLMIPCHPLKLRWIGSYLEASLALLSGLLSGNEKFAARAGEPYLDWLEGRIPDQAPPILIGSDSEIIYSRSESSWYEEYAKFESGFSLLEEDPASTLAICRRIENYLDAHPFKKDGLSLLLLLPTTDTLAAELLTQLSAGGLKPNGRITITVAAPKKRWESIARAVERGNPGDRSGRHGELFPRHDLAFVEFDQGAALDTAIGSQKFDLAVVTHLLNRSLQQQQNTEPVLPLQGKFDPLLDQTTQMVTSKELGATSIIMRPKRPDAPLETWGTLVIRSNRASPVSRAQPENTDFVELRLNFDESARVFNVLHQACHWVITLERHISRKQIESAEAGSPDILSIVDGVGANGLNALVVSSRSGRDLIQSRLSRKIKKLVPEGELAGKGKNYPERLAKLVYDETRRVAPHLALSAMGISRVTEEILGLAVARSIAEELAPVPNGRGKCAWISLDEYCDWFGGSTSTRADMCRISLRLLENKTVLVDVMVLEGKLRQGFDPHGVIQAEATRQFMHDVLSTSGADDARKKIDARLWRERILSAIESCAEEAVTDLCGEELPSSESLWQEIRHEFRAGNYILQSESAVYSICLWESQDPDVTLERSGTVLVAKSSNRHILSAASKSINLGLGQKRVELEDEEAGSQAFPQFPPENDVDTIAKDANLSDTQVREYHGAEEGFYEPRVATAPTKKRMRVEELRALYDEILACFSSHGVAVVAANPGDEPITEGPASILFKVKPGSGIDPKKLFEKSEALKLHLQLDQEQTVGFGIDRGYVTVDVPKSPEQRYFVDAIDLWASWKAPSDALVTPLGEDSNGEIVAINFSSPNSPHLLIGGTTGSGKSEALNTILYGLVQHYRPEDLKILLVDPKGTELSDFERYDHLEGSIGWEDVDAIEILRRAVGEMQNRYLKFREAAVKSLPEFNLKVEKKEDRLPWWIIVLDEYADLTSDVQNKKEIEQELKRLAQKARAAGIHVVIATQKPSADVISTNLRSNLPAQLALRVKSGTESRVIMDSVGAEALNGKGDAYFKSEGKLRRIQCARVEISRLQAGS